jgi:hypothetical protein
MLQYVYRQTFHVKHKTCAKELTDVTENFELGFEKFFRSRSGAGGGMRVIRRLATTGNKPHSPPVEFLDSSLLKPFSPKVNF